MIIATVKYIKREKNLSLRAFYFKIEGFPTLKIGDIISDSRHTKKIKIIDLQTADTPIDNIETISPKTSKIIEMSPSKTSTEEVKYFVDFDKQSKVAYFPKQHKSYMLVCTVKKKKDA